MPADLPADVQIDVVFASSTQAALAAQISNPAIVIFADSNTWNDHGWRLFANYRVYRDGEFGPLLPMRFMFAEQVHTDLEIARLLAQRPNRVMPIEQVERLYCSLLLSPEAYRDLVRQIGFDHAVSALRKMGDAVVVQMEGRDQARQLLMDSDAFYIGILRADGAYAALRRGGRFLRRDVPEQVRDAAQSFLIVAQLPNVRNQYDVTINFEDDIIDRNRVAVLIGRNGVGKTQLLRHLVLRLAQDFEQPGLAGQVRLSPSPRAERVLLFSSVASDPYPRSIPPWFGIDYEYFSLTAPQDAGSDALLQALVSCKRNAGSPLTINGQHVYRLSLLEHILSRLGLWEALHIPLRPHQEGVDPFRHLSVNWEDGRYYPISVNLGDGPSLQFVRMIDWARAPLIFSERGPRHLSSGEMAMFRFAAQAVSAIEQGSLLLFDEPETHLHPNFISDFMEILQDLLNATSSAAIIATHSAYVVREVPRERVNVLSSHEGEISVGSPRLQTFGASIDTISQFVFNDTSISHRFQQLLLKWVRGPGEGLTLEQIVAALGDQLNPESLSYIAEIKRRDAAGGGN